MECAFSSININYCDRGPYYEWCTHWISAHQFFDSCFDHYGRDRSYCSREIKQLRPRLGFPLGRCLVRTSAFPPPSHWTLNPRSLPVSTRPADSLCSPRSIISSLHRCARWYFPVNQINLKVQRCLAGWKSEVILSGKCFRWEIFYGVLWKVPDDASKKKLNGGAERDRTVGLLNAIQALSQLSYSPTRMIDH